MSPAKLEFDLKLNERFAEQVEAAIEGGLDEALEFDVKPLAKELSPKKTGHNARTIDHEVRKEDGEVVGELFTQSGYGGYLEIGTSKMAARPYLFPAARRAASAIYEAIRRRLSRD